MNLKLVLQAILQDYVLPWNGDHGVAHWARVLENGLHLAATTGANTDVVSLFAVFHDCRRVNEDFDPQHGLRGGEFAKSIRGQFFQRADHDFQLLYRACEGHTHEKFHPDSTIQTCWDADRLDLGRVGVTPHPSRLGTALAKTTDMINWATERAIRGVEPSLVLDDWGIHLQAKE